MDSRLLLINAGILLPTGEKTRNGLTPEQFSFVEKAFQANPADELLLKTYLEAIAMHGVTLHNQKNHTEAILWFRKGLTIYPDSPMLLHSLGCSLAAENQHDAAIEEWKKAIKVYPTYVEPLIALGNALIDKGRFTEAKHYLRQALAAQPEHAEALHFTGVALHQERCCDEAREYYERAIRLSPDSALLRSNYGKLLLLMGDLEMGFKENEWRVKKQDIQKTYYHGVLNKPAWRGELFSGKRLLVHREQGLGDVIHFARYLPMVKARGGIVAFSAPPELMKLFSRLAGVDILVEHNSTEYHNLEFDLVVPLMSLPYIFGTTLRTVPAPIPYVTADSCVAGKWRSRLPEADGLKRIGLVWAAKMTDDHSRKRSCGLAAIAPLCSIPGVHFYSLQKGEGAEELKHTPLPINDMTEDLHDFADTAALIANLDLVITVDTSVAHLSGAMGKPTWLLQTYMPDWRWMLDRDDSPWYPTIRLFRQAKPGDWAGVIDKASQALVQWVNAPSADTSTNKNVSL